MNSKTTMTLSTLTIAVVASLFVSGNQQAFVHGGYGYHHHHYYGCYGCYGDYSSL
ncbi:MAG: hypothetical protein WA667_04855 [Candidatus Nitrosopolaris sp.]